MLYNFVADGFHTKKLEDFLQVKYNFTRKTVFLRFWSFFGTGGPRTMFILRIVELLLVLIELFSLGVRAEALRASID